MRAVLIGTADGTPIVNGERMPRFALVFSSDRFSFFSCFALLFVLLFSTSRVVVCVLALARGRSGRLELCVER